MKINGELVFWNWDRIVTYNSWEFVGQVSEIAAAEMTEDAEKRFEKAMGKLFHSKLPSTPTSSAGTPSSKEPVHSRKSAQLGQMSKRPSSSSRVSGLSPTLTGNKRKSISTSINAPSPVCRPWDRGDLMRRLATFKSMTWFGKPKVVGPVNCARRGWVNVDVDLIACEACGGRLSFSTPPTWTQRQVESAADIFSTKLDDGHKSLCPWKGNECKEDLAHFPPTPAPALVESYRDRCDALLQLPALPVVCSSAIEEMKLSRAPQIDRLLAQPPPLPSAALSRNSGKIYGIEIVGDESAATGANFYYQDQRLISLCGWEPRLLPYVVDCEDHSTQPVEDACPGELSPRLVHVHSPSVQLSSKTGVNEAMESSQNKSVDIQQRPEPPSVVLDCSLCGASVGMWAFSTVYRPLQLVTNGSLESQEICKKLDDSSMRGMSAASCVGGVSTSEVKGKEHPDDASEAMTSSCQKDVTNDRILDLSLTIAGGLPPTKQSINSLLPLPSIIQQGKHGFHCSSEVGDWVTSESHDPRDKIQSTGNYDSSAHSKRENTESTNIDKEGIDTAASSKRKRMEASSEVSRGISQVGQVKTPERFSDAEDNTRNKRKWNGPAFGERRVQELASSEFHGYSSVNAVDTCYHDRRENSTESVDNVQQVSCKSDEGIEEGTATNIATISTGRIGGISVGMNGFPELIGAQIDGHGDIGGNDLSVNRSESRACESEILAENGRSGRGEVSSMGDKTGCVSICEDSQHALLVNLSTVDFTSSKDSIVEFRAAGERSEVYQPSEIHEKQEKSDAMITGLQSSALERDAMIRPAQVKADKIDNALTSGSGRHPEQKIWGKGMEFNPIKQHRHFCPWVTVLFSGGMPAGDKNTGVCGWQLTADALDQCTAQELASASLKESGSTSSRYKVNPVASVRQFFESPSSKKRKHSHVHSSTHT